MVKKKLGILLLHLVIGGVGASMVLKANIGMAAAWDGLSLSMSELIHIKVGYLSMMFNFLCIAVQFVILKRSFSILRLFQIPVAVILGVVINTIYYSVFGLFTLPGYAARVVFAILGFVLMAYAASAIISVNLVSFPLEAMCMVVSERYHVRFGLVRQLLEGSAMIIILFIVLVFHGQMTIREGTVIWILIQGPLFDFFLKVTSAFYKKKGVV